MQDKIISKILGNKNIYPVTVWEMVAILKPLIDAFRSECLKPNNKSVLQTITNEIKLRKRVSPKLFAQSRRYLRAKRLALLKSILVTNWK